MLRYTKLLAGFALCLSVGPSLAWADSFICQEPGGKRLIQISGNDVSKLGGNTLIYIDGNDLLVGDPHAKATLVVDDDDVRHSAAGVKLATFDGDDLRHGKGGKVIINYHHPDICPTSADNRIYSIEGDQLNKQQLVAGLYLLKPELFKLSDEETAAQQKAIKDAGDEADKAAAADQVAGKWMLLNGTGPVEKTDKGTITVAPKTGETYPVSFDMTANGGPQWNGVGTYKMVSGDKSFWVAYGTPKTIGLCVYEIKGGVLDGKWYPWYTDGDAKNVGTESLKGPETLDGDFTITDAKAPTTGAAYSGTVTIKPLAIVGANDDAKPYSITWTLGSVKVFGIGIKSGNFLYVSSGSGADVNIAKYTIDNGSMHSDWFKLGAKDMGGNAATTSN